VRYTILAVLTQLMCDSFNHRIELGLPRDAPAIIEDFAELQARPKVYEEPPEWAKRALLRGNVALAAAPEEKVFIPNAEGRKLDEDDEENVSREFKDVGVIVQMPHIHYESPLGYSFLYPKFGATKCQDQIERTYFYIWSGCAHSHHPLG